MDTRGIYEKYKVERIDGQQRKGEKHHQCRYFVLDLDHDPHARLAIKTYADSCRYLRPQLAIDLDAVAAECWGFCRGCRKALLKENERLADCCQCNAQRGINHGLVPKEVCTCVECDPEQTGVSRVR